MPILSQHTKGLVITALGVLIISPDGLLTRLIHVDHWTLIFWRTLFLSLGMWMITSFTYPNRTWQKYKSMGRGGVMMALIYSLGTISFVHRDYSYQRCQYVNHSQHHAVVCRNNRLGVFARIHSTANLDSDSVSRHWHICHQFGIVKIRYRVCSVILLQC